MVPSGHHGPGGARPGASPPGHSPHQVDQLAPSLPSLLFLLLEVQIQTSPGSGRTGLASQHFYFLLNLGKVVKLPVIYLVL